MAARTVTSIVNRPNGSPWKGAEVRFQPTDDTFTVAPDATYPIAAVVAVADETGLLTVTLAAGLSVSYRVTLPDGEQFTINVPNGAPVSLEFLRASYNGYPADAPPDLQLAIVSALTLPANQALISHSNLQNIGANSHVQIDTHVGSATGVHGVGGSVVGTTGAQTLADKTLGAGTKVAVGADGTGDVYHRAASGLLTRVPIGTAGQALVVNAGATAPEWGAVVSGGGSVAVKEGNVNVVAVATSIDFAGADFNVTDGTGGRAVVALAAPGGGGGGGTGATTIPGSVVFGIGDASSTQVVAAGTKGYVRVPFACTITGWTVLANVATTAVLDVWKVAAGTALPTDAQRIAGTAKPTLTAAAAATSAVLTGWTTAVAAGDLIGVEVESNDLAAGITLQINFDRVVVNQYTNEDAQDAVGLILTDSTSIDFTYDDVGNTISAVVLYGGTAGDFGSAATAARSDHAHAALYAALAHGHASTGITDFAEAVDDRVAALVVSSTTVAPTYDDAANTLSLATIDNASTQKHRVSRAGVLVGTRREVNIIDGANVTTTVADDAVNDRVNVTIASAAGTGGSSMTVQEGNVSVVATATVLDFDASDFNVADATGGRATVALAYGTGAGTPAEGNHGHTSAAITDFAEAAQDAALGALVAIDSTSIDFTYTDAANTIAAAVIYGGSAGEFGTAATAARSDHGHDATALTNFAEGVRDVVGVTLVAGTGIVKTVSDPLDTTTIAADIGTGAAQVAAGNHGHTSAGITDFAEAVDDRVGALVIDTTSIDATYDDAAGQLSLAVKYAGGGAATTAARSDHTHAYTSSLSLTGTLVFEFGDPTGSALTTTAGAVRALVRVPFACTLTNWYLTADASATATLDVWKQAFATGVPADAQRIAASAKPLLAGPQQQNSGSCSTWTTAVAAGDYIAVEIEAVTVAKYLSLTLDYTRTVTPTIT